jgi:hypothetical protein
MKPTVIEPMAVTRLRPVPGNARTHSKKQIRQIADSIARFGFTNPVLIDNDNTIIAGHGRVEAAKLLGLKSVPTLRLSRLDATERKAYALADNKLALNARWDRRALAVELKALADLEFDAEVTGFSCAEIELVPGGASEGRRVSDAKTPLQDNRSVACDAEQQTIADAAVVSFRSPASRRGHRALATVTKGADLWLMDRHRLLCADPNDLTTIDRMLGGKRLVFVAFEPALCDCIVHRFRQLTGQDATLAASGQSFATVAAQRSGRGDPCGRPSGQTFAAVAAQRKRESLR